MFFNTIFASFLALSLGVAAAPAATPTDIDPGNTRKVQLRLYGKSGCFAQNLGELGVYGDRVNKCQTFGAEQVRSVRFESQLAKGCSLAVYNDVTCHLNRHDVAVGSCVSGDKSYGSYIVNCPV